MNKKAKTIPKRKLLIVILLLVFMFSVIRIGVSLAGTENFEVTGVSITNKSENVKVNNISYEKTRINSDITFYNVGDSVTYKLSLKNNTNDNYKVKSLKVNNENEYLEYSYNSYDGTNLYSKDEVNFSITAKYAKEVTDLSKRNQSTSAVLVLTLEDEKGDISVQEITVGLTDDTTLKENEQSNESKTEIVGQKANPKTGDDIVIYVITAASALIMIIFIKRNKSTVGSRKHRRKSRRKSREILFGLLFAIIVIPEAAKAAGTVTAEIAFNSNYGFMDKIIFSYVVNGEEQQIIGKYGDVIELPADPEKLGYEFEGWYTEAENGNKVEDSIKLSEDTKIYAHFKVINYDIEYALDKGQATNPTQYTVEDEITLNRPERTGYTFKGWTGTGLDDYTLDVKIEKGSTGKREYKANYTANTNTKYTVKEYFMLFEENSYELKKTQPLEGTSDDEIQVIPTEYPGFNTPEAKTITIAADGKTEVEFKYSRKKFQLTIEDEEFVQTTTPSNKYYYDTSITLKAIDRQGYTFEKWSSGETTKEITFSLKDEKTIKPIYSKDSYEVKFETNGGSSVDSVYREYGEKIGELPKSTKANKVLVGWYSDVECTIGVTADTEITQAITFYAKWRDLEEYTIQFETNGGSGDAEDRIVIEGNSVGELPTLTKENYKFRGWFADEGFNTQVSANTKPTESTKYYAKWVDKYELVFYIPNEVEFKGSEESIPENQVPAQYLGYDGKFVNTNIALFNSTNKGKDFELGFEIVSYDPNDQDSVAENSKQFALVNTKNENGTGSIRPGFVFRVNKEDRTKFELVASTTKSSTYTLSCVGIKKVVIYREEGKIYYSINGGEKTEIRDLSDVVTFSTPLTFGASLKTDGIAYRHVRATLKEMYLKLEVDD